MKHSLSQTDLDFLERLQRLGGGSVQRMCNEFELTATAVRQRLGRLEALGMVSRELERGGRGRPHHSYQVAADGLRELGDNYGELAMILWREICNIEDADIRRRVFDRIRSSLAKRYGQRVSADASLPERLVQLQSELVDHGFDVEIDITGQLPILRENSCPYHDLAETDSSICEMEQEIFREILGTEMELTQCCLDGHHCCEFQPVGISVQEPDAVVSGN